MHVETTATPATDRRQAMLGLAAGACWPMTATARTSRRVPERHALPLRVGLALPDRAQALPVADVQLGGWLGARIAANAGQRLLNVDTAPLLAGFQHPPGSHPWIGEHIGKWLHAATLAWAHHGDAALRAKLDAVVTALLAAQEADGYLGTYEPARRFGLYDGADWDVWSHKYGLIGLLTYHRYTGHAGALRGCRRIADLLLATFPARRSILAAGTHLGMAATSVLEPIVLLYQVTGDARYLRFARYLVRAWDEPGGPALLPALRQARPVNQVANGKAYEMLSNLVGLCELARLTGEPELLQAVLNAWQDVVERRLYATGTTSQHEHFQADHDLRDGVDQRVGETCVTTTWIQLNLALLQATGQARFADELERSFYNHLTAAQHPAGDDWCYFTALSGRKQYDRDITCCHSSGPRGLALAPLAAYLRAHDGTHDVLLVNTFESSGARLSLGGGVVTVQQDSGFPYRGGSVLTLRMARPLRFGLKVRAPAWAQPLQLAGARLQEGWAELAPRLWHDGDHLPLGFQLASRRVDGSHGQATQAALTWGPFVLACESSTALPPPRRLGLLAASTARPVTARAGLAFEAAVDAPGADAASPPVARFLAFADAGATAGRYQVWLRAPGVAAVARRGSSVLVDGDESRSRDGNGRGSIIDDDPLSLANTWNGQPAREDWFAVTLDQPVSASRIVFTHGRNFHDGGWFDTQAGAPRVQVQRRADAAWDTVGLLKDYPATTATDPGRLQPAQAIELRLPARETFVALRVIGTPSCGDRPQQAFVTCAELQAFVD